MKIGNMEFSYSYNRQQVIKNQQQSMRQDLRERQRQIRKLHQSIQKYQQSPNTKKAVEHATSELINAIQYKYRRSQINRQYVFPINCQLSDDEFDDFPEVVDLKAQTDFLSQDLSVAEEPQSNFVYISEKTIMEDKYSPFSKRKTDKVDNKSRLKIKVVKRKNQQSLQTTEKLDRLKTEHIQTNFSTASYKTELRLQNQLTTSKSRLVPPSSEAARLRQKLKIASRIQKEQPNSPFHPNLTMKTEYTHCTKRKQNKENQRSTMNPHTSSLTNQKYYVGHHQKSSKKVQQNNFKLYLNVRCAVKKNMNMNMNSHSNLHCTGNGSVNNNCNPSMSINYLREMKNDGENLDMSKKKKVCHKSFQSLKSIRLGHNRSTQKLMAKGIHA